MFCRYFGYLRVDSETEDSGNDAPHHGETAYPVSAWIEEQYDMQHPRYMVGTK